MALKGFTGKVAVINTATNTVIGTVKVGANPAGIALNADGTRAYVTNSSGNSVSVIDTANSKVLATVTVGAKPDGVVVGADGSRVYVANTNADSVSVINTATNKVIATVKVGDQPRGLAIGPDGAVVAVAGYGDNSVWSINTATNTVRGSVGVGPRPTSVAIGPDSSLYVANSNDTVTVFDADSGNVSTINATPDARVDNGEHVLALGADGRVWVSDTNDNAVRVISLNAAPVASPDTYSIDEDSVLSGPRPGCVGQ